MGQTDGYTGHHDALFGRSLRLLHRQGTLLASRLLLNRPKRNADYAGNQQQVGNSLGFNVHTHTYVYNSYKHTRNIKVVEKNNITP